MTSAAHSPQNTMSGANKIARSTGESNTALSEQPTTAAVRITPVFDELTRQAAQGDVLHNDDTSMTVLSLRRDIDDESDDPDRTGIFTSGIVSTREGRKIALFFTSRQHAGENLRDIL